MYADSLLNSPEDEDDRIPAKRPRVSGPSHGSRRPVSIDEIDDENSETDSTAVVVDDAVATSADTVGGCAPIIIAGVSNDEYATAHVLQI